MHCDDSAQLIALLEPHGHESESASLLELNGEKLFFGDLLSNAFHGPTEDMLEDSLNKE